MCAGTGWNRCRTSCLDFCDFFKFPHDALGRWFLKPVPKRHCSRNCFFVLGPTHLESAQVARLLEDWNTVLVWLLSTIQAQRLSLHTYFSTHDLEAAISWPLRPRRPPASIAQRIRRFFQDQHKDIVTVVGGVIVFLLLLPG